MILFKERGIKRMVAKKLVNHLIMEQLIIPGRKHTSQTILKNPTRFSIYRYITEEKVAQYSEVKMKLGISSESMYRIHLESLENFGLIKNFAFGGIRLLCSNEMNEEKAVYYYRLKKKKYFDIINLFCNSGSLRIVDINLHLKIDAKYSVKNLVEIDLIIKKNKKYIINPDKKEEIKKIINHIKLKK